MDRLADFDEVHAGADQKTRIESSEGYIIFTRSILYTYIVR